MSEKRIYKYVLEVTNTQELALPGGAQILHVDFQGKELCLWAQVDPGEIPSNRTFKVYGTGHLLRIDSPDRKLIHLGTVQQSPFVWHVFEQVRR